MRRAHRLTATVRRLALAAVAGAVAIGALAVTPPAVAATPPGDLDAGYVSDWSGVLSDAEERRLEQRLERLAQTDDRPELYVVFVDEFADPSNALRWADRMSLENNLGADQYLLAIATEGRALAISAEYEGGGPLSESRVLEIEDRLGSAYLAQDDWAGGVEYVADEFDKVPPPWWVWVLGALGLALLVFVIVQLVLHGRRRAARALELRTLEGQKRRASVTLVRTDEALRTSEQELGFVTAEFGDEATHEFAQVLAEGRTQLDRAFELQRKLEDAIPDTDAETRSWTEEILSLCGAVDRSLDERTRALKDLRGLAKDATATVERLTRARAEADELVAAADAQLTALRAQQTPDQLAGIDDDPEEMREHLRHADEWLGRLRDAAARGRATAIGTAVHEIERDLAEVSQLHAAVAARAAQLVAETGVTVPPAGAPGADGPGVLPLFARTNDDITGNRELDRAAASVRVAESAIAARPGRVAAQGLTALHRAQQELALARAAVDDPEKQAVHARAASSFAEQARQAAGPGTTAATSPSDRSATERAARPSYVAAAADDDDTGAKAGVGALGGGAVGFFGGLGVLGDADEPGAGIGLLVLFTLGGAALGALSGLFGGEGGGSSSGWGGSSSGSWSRSSSRGSRGGGFSSRSSGRSSRSFSSSRSSGRSGGRRF
ncbi:TPM domain-containing protein [Microbacterium marinilacus]|uniref:TPM domain-containing protein n=1 Tax=Microbacterium marinilacus TaxID=415209 RepID=A0ABP7B620_9MICO|nr:TPM domain-containing protein [Microbacterium marinilacus]MBY0690018.1 TPM domain-containing protein [Microbacterium marinilacus]